MSKPTQSNTNDIGTLAEDARALMAATAELAGDRVGEARKGLAEALRTCKDICGRVRDKAVEGAKVTDQVMHAHPYAAIGMGIGAGALIAYLVARRWSRNVD